MPTQSNIDNWEKRFTDDFGYMHESCRDFIRSLLHTTRQKEIEKIEKMKKIRPEDKVGLVVVYTDIHNNALDMVISSLKSNI